MQLFLGTVYRGALSGYIKWKGYLIKKLETGTLNF
jgi:hypothetical protein